MKADETPAEKGAEGQGLAPTIVVGIANDKTGEYEEEVDGKVAVVDEVDGWFATRKLESLKHVIPHDKKGCHTS